MDELNLLVLPFGSRPLGLGVGPTAGQVNSQSHQSLQQLHSDQHDKMFPCAEGSDSMDYHDTTLGAARDVQHDVPFLQTARFITKLYSCIGAACL